MKNSFNKFVVTVVLISLQFSFIVNATNWYVDNAATGANNGTSWTDAWQSFADISWGSIAPGDNVYISGGTTEKIYNERLNIRDLSGTVDAPVTISVGQDAGHNGTVIIDNEYVVDRWQGLVIVRSSNVVVTGQIGLGDEQKIRITRAATNGVLIQSNDSIILKYLEVCENGESGQSGIAINMAQAPTNIEIAYCDIHDNYNDGIHTGITNPDEITSYDAVRIHHNKIRNIHDDGIESDLNGLSIYNNEIGQRIYPHRGHPDNMQLSGKHMKIYNNYIYDWIANDETEFSEGPDLSAGLNVVYIGQSEGTQFGEYGGHIMIYNNLIVENEPLTNSYTSHAITLAFGGATWTDVSDVYVFNNTISGDFANGILAAFRNVSTHEILHDFYIMNNNLYNSTHNLGYTLALNLTDGDLDDLIYGNYGDDCDIMVDYNCLYGNGTSNIPGYPDNLEYNENGISIDPLVNLDFRPSGEYSPIVDSGFDITTLTRLQSILSLEELADLRTDKDGNPRLESNDWDIGAYEYTTETNINNKFTGGIQFFRIYPNPFKANTSIAYSLQKNSDVEISLYDVTGRKVQTLFEGYQIAGEHTLDVELHNIEAGVFLFQLETGTYKAMRKCIITH